jgi:hypothetical protein
MNMDDDISVSLVISSEVVLVVSEAEAERSSC